MILNWIVKVGDYEFDDVWLLFEIDDLVKYVEDVLLV